MLGIVSILRFNVSKIEFIRISAMGYECFKPYSVYQFFHLVVLKTWD